LGIVFCAAGSCGEDGNTGGVADDPESTYGIEGEFGTDGVLGKADSAGVAALPVSVEGASTQVWEVENDWEDTDTAAAREAGIAWEADSGLNWDEKYQAWIQSMEKIDGHDTYYETFELTTPWDKSLPAPKLECAELAIFLRITFASWYNLPFYITAVDSNGDRVYFGHFGARTRAGRYKNTPLYKSWYHDYSHMSTADIAAQGWPQDDKLRGRGLYGGGDDMDYVFEGARAGGYFDEVFLNKRVGHFMRLVLAYFGSMNLASSRNTYNLKPQAVQAGDVLLERWQRTGIGHTLVVKQVTPLEGGHLEAQLASSSMPRRQPKWEDGASSKRYFTLEETGGEGTNSDGDEYAKLGGGLKRWRVAKKVGGYWKNTWMEEDEASWICDTDYDRIAARPAQFEDLLGEVDPADLREALLHMIEDSRNHLRQYPASCAARIRREEAFDELYELNETEFGVSRAETDRQYRKLEDYVFAELVYEDSKTCCWCSSTSAMYQIIMDYNEALMEDGCQEPVVFKAMGGGYDVFEQFAEDTGRGHLWRPWSEDEPCPQRDTDNDIEADHDWIAWCEASEGTPQPPACEDDIYEPNDNPTQATAIAEGTFQNLVICEESDDYFAIDFTGGTLTVRIEFNHDDGDLDMAIYQGSEQLDVSQSTGNAEELTVSGGSSYTIRVYGYNGATNTYNLSAVID
jgi:hypothetical protein